MSLLEVKKTGASFARGGSKQDYSTPRVFLDKVEGRWGKLEFDLAAHHENAVAPRFFGPPDEPSSDHGPFMVGRDSLACDWTRQAGNIWLNPPFDRIEPWARKCAALGDSYPKVLPPHSRIFFLVPAAVGANWWRDHVHDRAKVYFLNGRLSFDGRNPYPKDTALCVYGLPPSYEVWDWKHDRVF